jgi:ArsR family transcriptional regulator
MTEQESAFNTARAGVLKALGHPSRLYIVETLREKPHCVCELTELIGADTSTVSKHLSVLKAAGIVRDRKEGTTVYYSLACSCIDDILSSVESIVRSHVEQQQTALNGVTSAVN